MDGLPPLFIPKAFDAQKKCAMSNELSVSLDLNEEIRLFVQKRLREFASQNPQSKFNIVCCIDEINIDLVAELDDYLIVNDCPDRLKTGGDMIGKNRTTFFRITKKKAD